MNNARQRRLVVLLGLVLVGGLAVLILTRGTRRGAPQPAPGSAKAAVESARQDQSGAITREGAALEGELGAALDLLRGTPDARGVREHLARLRAALAAAATNEASAAIRRFLRSGRDARTGEGFKVGGGGFLDEAPTLRAFLLDYLGRIDPAAAAAYARIILASADSPDEWAVALRSLALGDSSPDAHALLEQKTLELLRHGAWQDNPSTGYLEAFDTAVYLGGTNLVSALGDLVRKQDNPAVAHAAYLALDRLVLSDPAMLLAALADPALMQGREATRADYFARADVRDLRQRQALEQYLLNPQITAAERQQFAGVFPNANFMISPNLLTGNPAPDHAALVNRDAASLQAVQEWLADPRFAGLRPLLERMNSRIASFVNQAASR